MLHPITYTNFVHVHVILFLSKKKIIYPANSSGEQPHMDALVKLVFFSPFSVLVSVFYFFADKQYRMAVLRGAYMTPEADDVRIAMARGTEAAFVRLAKAQVSEST